MPRTLDPVLEAAMDAGSYDPYLKVRLMVDDPAVYTTVDVLDFKITDITAECTIPYESTYLVNTAFAVERGVVVGGMVYSIRTVYYQITSMLAGPKGIHLTGLILPPYYSSFDGCIWYMDVIDKIIGPTGGWVWDTSVTYEDDTAPWLSYLFYPLARNLTLPNMQSFFNVMRQKYLIFFAENQDGLFVFQATTARAKDYDITDELLIREKQTSRRRLLWRDENMTIHYSGSAQDPLHNLGYIDTLQGAAPTNTPSPRPFKSSKLPVHLKYRTGDVAKLGTATNYFQGRIQVTEVFDPKSNPSWHVVIEPLCWYANTEGGAMPSTIEAAAPYTPLNTGYFNGVLSNADNNVQAAMETLDDHTHDHAALTNHGTNSHAQIDTFIASKGIANGLATLDANILVPDGQLYHKLDWPQWYEFLTHNEHFMSAPAWSGWFNQPTGANGRYVCGNHYAIVEADDNLNMCSYYRTITTALNHYACIIGEAGYQAEFGIMLADNDHSDYLCLGVQWASAFSYKLVKRTFTGGVMTKTDLVSGLPGGLYGLMIVYTPNPVYCFACKDIWLPEYITGPVPWFTPARLGFYFTKQAAGGSKESLITRWGDDFE